MDDLISRQAAIARAVPLNLFGREVMIVSVSELENLPSAQPEIIRCKDCEWGDIYVSDGNRYCYCMMSDPRIRTADDFCSYAERCKQ